jgi:hypothetical protein
MTETGQDTPEVQAAAEALKACVAGLALTHPRMLAFTDQVDWIALLVRTPLGESCALAALEETRRQRVNAMPGYLAAQESVIPLIDRYLKAVQTLLTGPDDAALSRASTQQLGWLKRELLRAAPVA